MSTSVSVNDSNIPISKRNYPGVKKSKGCAQLPELQRYIETIIKTNGERDPENTSALEKDKIPKEIRFGKRVVCRGLENKIRCEKLKFDMSRRKTKTKPKTTLSEAVSRGVEISKKFMFKFEDPRNWKFDRNQKLGSSLRIVNFLKKLYPNPYNLSSGNEFRKSKTDIIFEKVGKDDFRDGTLPDVVISKVDAQTEVDFESPDNVIENAELKIKSNERENFSNDIILTLDVNKCNPSPAHDVCKTEDFKNAELPILSTVTDMAQKSYKNKRSNSASNFSSRISSLESINEILCKQNQVNFKKRKNFDVKTAAVSEEKLPADESTSLKADWQNFDNNPNDYDIGKLKLLSMSDSDDSASKKSQLNLTHTENVLSKVANDSVTLTNSNMNDESNNTDELCDLLHIYSVMKKATESFIRLNSKKEFMNSELEDLENSIEDEKFTELINELNNDAKVLCSEKEEREVNKCSENCKKNKEIESGNITTEDHPKDDPVSNEEGKNEKNFFDNILNITHKEELELRNNLMEISSDKTKSSSKLDKEADILINQKDFALSETSYIFKENQEQNSKKEDFDTNQKIDDVLQFMYDCLKKFNSQEKLLQEEEKHSPHKAKKETIKKTSKKLLKDRMEKKTKKYSTSQFKEKISFSTIEKQSSESLSAVSLPDEKEIKSKYTAALNELTKKQNSKAQPKRRMRIDTIAPYFPLTESNIKSSTHYSLSSDSETISTIDLDSCDMRSSFDENNETCLQTAESQNELGGYTEETNQLLRIPNSDLPMVKSMFPFSIRAKNSKTDTFKTLKHVLEIEEKLLADDFQEKKSRYTKKTNEKHHEIVNRKSSGALIRKKTRSSYSFERDMNRPNSNFVICLNSFPRNLRTVTMRPNVPLSPPETISTSDLRPMDLKLLTYYPKHRSQRLSILPGKEQSVLQCSYKVIEGTLKSINKTLAVYIAEPICLKVVFYHCNLHEESSLKNSECQIKVRKVKKSLFVESNNPKTSRLHDKSTLIYKPSITNNISSENKLNKKLEEEKPIEALTEVLKKAEEKVILLEKTNDPAENFCRSTEFWCDSIQQNTSQILSNGTSDNEFEKEKIRDLLLRTYHLQQRLHQYLHKITYVQPCPLIQQEPFLDFDLFLSNKTESNMSLTEFEINQEHALPFVHWCLQPPKNIKKSKTDETVEVDVQTVDCGTSCSPPYVGNETNSGRFDESSCQTKHSPLIEKEEKKCQKLENDEDDKSSTNSFKSSNDISEVNQCPNQKKETSGHPDNEDLIKKLFNKIELFRQSFEEKMLRNWDKMCTNPTDVDNSNFNKFEEQKENQLVEYHPKTPAKVLKTVFKGRNSSTELTIGLKDVPMTKVNNISVEKTKLSPNHTKISICISKEKSEELRQSEKINNEILHNQLSSYYFDHIRPSLSTCQTKFSRLNDDVSKSAQSINEESDEDEEDYKSVGSTVGDSGTDEILEEKSKCEEKKTLLASPPPPKNQNRHKFDFYEKMNLNTNEDKGKETLASTRPRYKELEPLKKALTEMQIRMKSIKRDTFLSSNDYYERALKLAKMSAGFCQSCGTRAVIPDDTFGFYKTLLPRRCSHPRRCRPIRTALTPNSSFYSFRTGNAEINDRYYDLNIKHSSSYMLNRTTHLRSSVHDMPILFERV